MKKLEMKDTFVEKKRLSSKTRGQHCNHLFSAEKIVFFCKNHCYGVVSAKRADILSQNRQLFHHFLAI
jgi:hypothetical protein